MLILVISSPQTNDCGSYGHIRYGGAWHQYTGVRPGHHFDGHEGGDQTSWYTPAVWLSPAEYQKAVRSSIWLDDRTADMLDAEVDAMLDRTANEITRERVATPDDFPGLAEHHPDVVAAYHRHPAVAAAAAREFAVSLDHLTTHMPDYAISDWLRDRGHDSHADAIWAS